MGLGWLKSSSIIHTNLHKPNNKLINAKLEHIWCTDKPRTNMDSQNSLRPGLGGSHHLPPCSILCAWAWGQHPNVILSRDSQMGVPKFPKLGFPWLWGPITLCVDLQLRWGLKKSCSPRQELFKGMWHAIYTQGSQGNSQILVVESQIDNLTSGPSFGHNLCFNYPNGSYKPILDIYVPRTFQWYKRIFNPMCFDPWNFSLKIRESIWTSIPKVGTHLEVWGFIPSHSPTLPGTWNVTPRFHSWPAPSHALALVVNPRLGLRHLNLHVKPTVINFESKISNLCFSWIYPHITHHAKSMQMQY
jgi:hypothetical protein